jgi:hypothetical protein
LSHRRCRKEVDIRQGRWSLPLSCLLSSLSLAGAVLPRRLSPNLS